MSLFDDEEILHLIEKKTQDNSVEYNRCHICDKIMNFDVNCGYCCSQCGLIRESIGDHRPDYGNLAGFGQCVRICGPDHSTYQKFLYEGISSGYREAKHNLIIDEFRRINMFSKNIKFSQEVLDRAANLFEEVSILRVVRANVRQCTMAACLEIACSESGDDRRSKEIAEFMGLSCTGYSQGMGVLNALQIEGKISICQNMDPTRAFYVRDLKLLGIDEKYEGFVGEIIERAIEKSIGIHSLASTKCVGVIWVLIQAFDLPISKNKVDEICNIRKTTFSNFSSKIIQNKRKFKKIFKKYGVPYENLSISQRACKKTKK